MKRLALILTTAAIVFVMISCNKVKGPYIKEVEVTGNRVVLLEDYTGVKCVNCPAAAATAHELLEKYPNNLVVLSVHAGSNAQPPSPTEPDFRTEAGTTWYNSFHFASNPIGTVDRTQESNSYGYNDGAWGARVQKEINEGQSAALLVTPEYNDTTRKLDVNINSMFLKETEGDFYIFAGIMEDSIQAWQIEPAGPNFHYWHRHMFRAPLNGTWGQPLFKGYTEVDQSFDTYLSVTLDTMYRAEQCYIVSYIYDNNDKHILQADQTKIK